MDQLIYVVILMIIAELLRPKPKDAKPVPFEDLPLPQNDPTKKIPVVWGTVKLTAPHILSFPSYRHRAIRTSSGLFSTSVVGYRYYLGMALGLCRGPATLKRIFYGGREVWSGTADPNPSGVLITVNLPGFLGGRAEGGGIVGNFRFYGGGPTQVANPYLVTFHPLEPAYRHCAYIVLEDVNVGESPNIDGFSFEVLRQPNPLSLSGVTYHLIGDEAGVYSEINPASIVYELFTESDLAGYGLTDSEVDSAVFGGVAATLAAENNGMSLAWINGESVIEIMRQVFAQIDAVPRFNPTSGKWEIKLGRADYTVGSLPLLDETNSELVNYGRGNWTETVNYMVVQWQDRRQDGLPGPAIASDMSNFDRQGSYQPQTMNYPGCYSRDLANKLAARDLRTQSIPLAGYEIRTNREFWKLLPGDVVRYQNSQLGIVQTIIRVGQVALGDQSNGTMTINGVEDIFSLADIITAPPQYTLHNPVGGAPTDIGFRYVADQPYFLAIKDTSASSPGAVHKPFAVAASPQGNSLRMSLWARIGAESFVRQIDAPYVGMGTLQASLAENTADTLTSVVINNVDTGDISDDITTALGKSDIQQRGMNLAVIVSASGEPEFIAFESATISGSDLTLNQVHRGMLDTLPAAHLANDKVWLIGTGIATTVTEYTSAATVDVRLTNITSNGEFAVGSAANNALTFRDRITKPYLPGGFKVNGNRYPTNITAPSDLTFTWARRDRTRGTVLYQDDADDQIEAGTEYELKIYQTAGLVLKRTVSALTGVSYNYTQAQQAADGGPYTGYTVTLLAKRTTGGLTSLLTIQRVFTLT